MNAVAQQFRFIREASPAELEVEINNVKAKLPALTSNGRVRTPVTEQLQNYLNLLRQARAVA